MGGLLGVFRVVPVLISFGHIEMSILMTYLRRNDHLDANLQRCYSLVVAMVDKLDSKHPSRNGFPRSTRCMPRLGLVFHNIKRFFFFFFCFFFVVLVTTFAVCATYSSSA